MKEHDPADDRARLILGWQMTPTQEPKYWVGADPRVGNQMSDDLVTVPSEAMGSHTAIIAQSGSGKSFFLGRLIEELLVRTKSRCIIFDPNADFRKIHEIEDEGLWTSAKYDRQERRGKLPHEASKAEFERHWSPVSKATRVKMGGSESRMPGENYETLQLLWSSLSVEFLAEEIDPMLRSDLYHCHTFAQDIEVLFRLMGHAADETPDNLITETEKLFRQASNQEEDFRSSLDRVDVDKLIGKLFKGHTAAPFREGSELADIMDLFSVTTPRFTSPPPDGLLSHLSQAYKDLLRLKVRLLKERIMRTPKYVDEGVGHFYFSKAREYQMAGILQTKVQRRHPHRPKENRLEVVDLPSLKNKATTLLAINTILSMEWDRAKREWSRTLEKPLAKDDRVPTFIVVDEAHNLIPAETRGKAEYSLREQFRTIVAEGRKYGLFLILVSQRPDKLDPLVLSECENKAIMKLSSGSVLKITKKMLGLDDIQPKLLEKSLDFETGRALLVGRWAQDSPQLLYCAARRTIEGGRNLRKEHWASPYETARRAEGAKKSGPPKGGRTARPGKRLKASKKGGRA